MIQQLLAIFQEANNAGTLYYGMMGFFGDWPWMGVMMIGGMILGPLLAIWTYQDAKQQSEYAVFWGLVVLFTMGFGIILYALIRKPSRLRRATYASSSPPQPSQSKSGTILYSPRTQNENKPDTTGAYSWDSEPHSTLHFCTNCGSPLESDALFCPNCGKAVGSA